MKTLRSSLLALALTLISQPAMNSSISKEESVLQNEKMIADMIFILQPNLKEETRNELAKTLYAKSIEFRIDPKIMVVIIATESNFRNHVVSSTGDLSLAQINTEVWNKEFERLGLDTIDTDLLKKDYQYAVHKMAKILNILQSRYAGKDSHWYATYHSKTRKHKRAYNNKLQERLNLIAVASY